ncbi:16S rRNA-processing protein RimM [Oceaniovalibus guishaninsula JLT2003]|uniref:Ribosome maturation factor RimM n=1 Tax=Oceaniovalibus guishaninsula JLT2003 TaxID=1231392 RepID=K2I9R2_9RHOB|nr:ribosome maturation factor RimM [Oceaniovalibus guishaninsula]EKE45685.1 16S rRNA-processing protein RimM [Oceaniovalibus guishaninsula JLT2003]
MTSAICVGVIGGAFGVRGEVRLKSYCADPAAIADYGPLRTEDGATFAVTLQRPIKDGYAARLSGIATPEAAEALRGKRLFAPRDRLPALPDEEYYHADLIGLGVVGPGGAMLGRVLAVVNHGADDLLEIAPEGGGETVLLPFTRKAVPTVDLAAGRIVADPPDGIFPGSGDDG